MESMNWTQLDCVTEYNSISFLVSDEALMFHSKNTDLLLCTDNQGIFTLYRKVN
jgi:hypothetical protein